MADETTETPQDEAVTTEPVAAPEPEEQLTPKQRRQRRRARARSRQGGGPARTLEEKIAAREEERRQKAAQRRRRRAKEKEARAEARAAAPPTAEADQAPEHGPGRPKQRQGVVVSAKPDKTVIVRLDMVRRHQRYRKILRSTVKVSAHDERNDANEGDTVRVVECRPMSATKRWRLLEIVERAR